MEISEILKNQKEFFKTGETLSYDFRLKALNSLEKAIKDNTDVLLSCLERDLGKCATEGYLTEVSLVLEEVKYMKRHLRSFMKKGRVHLPLSLFGTKGYVQNVPYGTVLIMLPWNYPVLLSFVPLIGAIAAGNTAVVKPSSYSEVTAVAIKNIIEGVFKENYVSVVLGSREVNEAVLKEKYDYIFFTGSVAFGKEVMKKASETLTPLTLELGGKSPVFISRTADIERAAKRCVFGKLVNVGQTCIAPDYFLVEKCVKEKFISALKKEITEQYGGSALLKSDYGKIINEKHFKRLLGLIDEEKLVFGGHSDAKTLQIEPTILDGVKADDKVMQEEIFGPIFPILEVENSSEAFEFIASRPHPLALYIFSKDKAEIKRFTETLAFGGGCVNDTLLHIASPTLAFGGVGESGMGSYHGKHSFESFSHKKSIVKRGILDVSLRYRPFTTIKEKLLRLL